MCCGWHHTQSSSTIQIKLKLSHHRFQCRSNRKQRYLILVLNLQHGSGAAEVLNDRLCLFKELLTVYRPLQKDIRRTGVTNRLVQINSFLFKSTGIRLPFFCQGVEPLCCPESLTGWSQGLCPEAAAWLCRDQRRWRRITSAGCQTGRRRGCADKETSVETKRCCQLEQREWNLRFLSWSEGDSPALSKLNEPGGDVPRHDYQRVLQLTVGFGSQFTVYELIGS